MSTEPDYQSPRGTWVQTAYGYFYPENPRPEDVRVSEIAHALGMLCRFNGHCLIFYSVAEHCCHIYDALLEAGHDHEEAGWGLFHDAAEAYIGDLIRPMKAAFPVYYDWENRLLGAVAEKLHLPREMPEIVKEFDTRILRDERDQILSYSDTPDAEWGCPLPGLGVTIRGWEPTQAKVEFVYRYHDFMRRRSTSNMNHV